MTIPAKYYSSELPDPPYHLLKAWSIVLYSISFSRYFTLIYIHSHTRYFSFSTFLLTHKKSGQYWLVVTPEQQSNWESEWEVSREKERKRELRFQSIQRCSALLVWVYQTLGYGVIKRKYFLYDNRRWTDTLYSRCRIFIASAYRKWRKYK